MVMKEQEGVFSTDLKPQPGYHKPGIQSGRPILQACAGDRKIVVLPPEVICSATSDNN